MPSTGSMFAVIIIVVIILVGGAIGLLYLYPSVNHTLSPNKITTTTSTTTTTTPTTSSSTASQSYALQLVEGGAQPVMTSSLTSAANLPQLQGDGLGGDCGGGPCFAYNYYDNNNVWQIAGDIEPGEAWFNANSTGLTFTDQTCNPYFPNHPLLSCGPYWEWNGDKRVVNGHITGEENVSEVSGAISGIAPSAQVFSIDLTLPQYSFNGCEYNVSSTGCSYEGYVPAIQGDWAVDAASSGNTSYSVAIGLAEYCSELSRSFGTCISSTNDISVGLSTAAIVNGQYDASLSKNLPVAVSSLPYTPNHKLTIATDFHSYFEVWVDNILEYSSSTSPIGGGSNVGLNFYQFDNVDNMTLSTTWKNVAVYSNSKISVSGLSSGMTVVASGANGFNATAPASSTGSAVLDVSNQPQNLIVSVELSGKIIASYSSAVNAGAQFKLTLP